MSTEPTSSKPQADYPDHIDMPAPTVWPMVTAFGLTLLLAGLVTHWFVSLIGFIMALRGAVGWFREVMPHDRHEAIAVAPPEERPVPVTAAHSRVQHLVLGEAGHRVRVPAEIYPYKSGIKGGIVGGIVMAAMAVIWSLLFKGNPWWVINLLAAAAVPSLTEAGVDALMHFSILGLVVAIVMHVIISVCVGLLYAVALPMFPKHAFWWAGIFAPIAWTAFAYATMPLLNPKLDELVNWEWFLACQLGFGLTCGYVVARSERIETLQTWPLMARAGLHATHLIKEADEDGQATSPDKEDKS